MLGSDGPAQTSKAGREKGAFFKKLKKRESHVMIGPSEMIRWENLLTLKKNSSVH